MALVVLGRKLPLAADDFVGPMLLAIPVRAIFEIAILVSGIMLVKEPQPSICGETFELRRFVSLYYVAMFSVVGLILLGFLGMLYVSTRGTLPDYQDRVSMDLCVYPVLVLYLVEFGFVVWGTVVLTQTPKLSNESSIQACVDAQNRDADFLKPAVLIGWGDCLLGAYACGLLWYLSEGMSAAKKKHNDQLWADRLQWSCSRLSCLTCFLFGGIGRKDEYRDVAFLEVSSVFNDFFQGTSFFVVTDLVASLFLLRAQQRMNDEEAVADMLVNSSMINDLETPRQRADTEVTRYLWNDSEHSSKKTVVRLKTNAARGHRISTLNGVPNDSPIVGKMLSEGKSALDCGEETVRMMRQGSKYAPYVTGIYGWKLFTYTNVVDCSPNRCYAQCAQSEAHESVEIRTLLATTGLSEQDVLYASFTNYFGREVPYAIVVTPEEHEMLILVRGTLSFADMITDAMIEPTEMTSAGERWGFDGSNRFVHKGFFGVAEQIRNDMERHGILHTAFKVKRDRVKSAKLNNNNGNEVMREGVHQLMDVPDLSPAPKLRVVGHSLGGGIGAILAMLLKPQFPFIRCTTYSMPGCVFDLRTANDLEEYVDNIWVGKDLVAVANWKNLRKLRGQLMDVIRRCKVSKISALRGAVSGAHASSMLYSQSQVPDTAARRQLKRRIRRLANVQIPDEETTTINSPGGESMFSKRTLRDEVDMYPPGKLLHLVKVETRKSSTRTLWSTIMCLRKKTKTERVFVPMFVPDRTSIDDGFQISTRMVLDHFPNDVVYRIQVAADRMLEKKE